MIRCLFPLLLSLLAVTPAAAADNPSFVVVTIDTLRADHVNASLTPVLHRLGRDGVVFDNAVSVGPLTLPSHASLLSGLYPLAHGVRDNLIFTFPAALPTYPELLRARGYASAAFVSAIVLHARFGLGKGFDVYDDTGEAVERSAAETLGRAGSWVRSAKRPFFLWVHLFEPHAPYAGSYADEVRTVDRELGTFFEFLRQQGLWENLLLSVTSDHGESLGEHGEKTHGLFIYDSTLRIPWILKAPKLKPRAVPNQVRILDILPTMLQLAGLPPAGTGAGRMETQGVSLASLLLRNAAPQLEAYSESYLPRHQFNWSELRSLRTERYKYIHGPAPELYDLQTDPQEKNNLAADKRSLAASLLESLRQLESRYSRPAVRQETDSVLAEKFLSLGYIGYTPASQARQPVEESADPKAKIEVYTLTMDALELSESAQPREALALLERAAALDDRVTQVYFIKGSVLGHLGRFAEAAQALERAVELNPRFVTARFKLALAYLTLRDYAKAEAALQSVLADEPRNFRALHNLAAVAYSRGDLQRAEDLEKQAVGINGDYFEAWNTLGAIYVVQKKSAAALQALQRATRLNPKSGQAFYNLSLALRGAGDTAAADRAAAQACQLDRRYCR